MSAIWGIIALNNNTNLLANSKELFEHHYKTTCQLDRYESYSSQNAYIGCGIQYITKESETETLPITNSERNIVFTADCILDNREELIELLSNQQHNRETLTSTPDGTLMYMAYLLYGTECVNYFRGLFSIAIWNELEHSLTLITDQLASRCLYYIRKENLIAFSTLLEPLLKIFPNTSPNFNYYKDFLLADPSNIYVVAGETPYLDISLMLPATHLTITAAASQTNTYWQLPAKETSDNHSSNEYGTQFLDLYKQCIADALRTSGEVGIAMSSGLDSSSIGVLAAMELNKHTKELHSYTFVPYQKPSRIRQGNTILDESSLVSEIAQMYSNINTTFLNNKGKNYFEDYDLCSAILEMPYKTGTFANHYEMCKTGAKKGCKIFLNGGYGNNTVSFGNIQHILYQFYLDRKYFRMLTWMKRYAIHTDIHFFKLLYRALRGFHYSKHHHNAYSSNHAPENIFLTRSILENYNRKERFSNDRHALIINSYIDKCNYRNHLCSSNLLMYLGVFETKFGLSTGMLLRDPTKDIRMLAFCNQLPYHIFACDGTPRWLIRNQFADLLPKSIINNWGQHALLNIDWIQRIRRDWSSIKPTLLDHLSTADNLSLPFLKYISKESLVSYIEEFDKSSSADERNIVHVCAIDGLLRYFLSQKNNEFT